MYCHITAALKCTQGYCCKCSNPGYLLLERFNGQPLLVCWPQMINGVVSHHAILNLHPPLPPVCLGTGWCEEGIHKNGGQILPAAETGRAAQDGHGQSHKPVFVQGGDGDDCFFLPSDRAITKTSPNINGQKIRSLLYMAIDGINRSHWLFVTDVCRTLTWRSTCEGFCMEIQNHMATQHTISKLSRMKCRQMSTKATLIYMYVSELIVCEGQICRKRVRICMKKTQNSGCNDATVWWNKRNDYYS